MIYAPDATNACGAVLYAAAVPYNIYQPGSTGLAEWLGMGLISHGLAHVMARLDELG